MYFCIMDIFILEPITERLAKDVILSVAAADGAPITAHIMSLGGDMLSGNAIAATLKNSPSQVTTNVIGVAASMAAVISQAGDVRLIAPDANFNIHNGAMGGVGRGTKEDHQESIDILEKMDATMTLAFAKSNLHEQALKDLMKEDKLLSAEEALAMGFFDGFSEPIGALASYNKQINDMSKVSKLLAEAKIAAIGLFNDEPTEEQKEAVAELKAKITAEVEEKKEEDLEEKETPEEILSANMVPRAEFDTAIAEILALIKPLLGAVAELPSPEETEELVEEKTVATLKLQLKAIKSLTKAPDAVQDFEQPTAEQKADWSVYDKRKEEIKEKNKR